jgi:phosphoribosylanthranilate isomerase
LALLLSSDVRFIEHAISELKTEILHLGASTDLLTASTVQNLKKRCGPLFVMRSIPVVGEESIAIARSYEGIADMLLLECRRDKSSAAGGSRFKNQDRQG